MRPSYRLNILDKLTTLNGRPHKVNLWYRVVHQGHNMHSLRE